MTALGAFTFVLHSHLPYARLAGRWPHGEEWIHEAASETYIPLLDALYDLRDEGVPYQITIGITPVLAEQLADPTICDHLDEYLDDKIARLRRDITRFAPGGTDEDAQFAQLAHLYFDMLTALKDSFQQRYQRDLIGAFKRLQDEGLIEITTSAATHGYLPLLGTDSAIRAQIQAGVQSYRRFFGRDPRGIWLPECAYRPAYIDDQGILRPGIEHFLAPHGLTVFFSETHLITGDTPDTSSSAALIGLYEGIERAYVLPLSDLHIAREPKTTFRAYYVADSTNGDQTSSSIAVLGRNHQTGQRVWSAALGYPGDFAYREFHRKDATSGFQYWSVTGEDVELGDKLLYEPAEAARRIQQHARDFVALVEQLMQEARADGQGYGIIASNYDTELFGHWWFEGVDWLKAVLRQLAASSVVDLVTAPGYIEQYPPEAMIDLPEGSWGSGGTHYTWDNPATEWMWEPIHNAERRMERLADHHRADWDNVPQRAVLNQAARELLLLESSDWPFLVTTGQARQYAVQRFIQHNQRFDALARSVENGIPDEDAAALWWELDHVFPDIDYRWWCSESR